MTRPIVALLAVGGALLCILGVVTWRHRADDAGARAPNAEPAAPSPLPSFARPEEAERYRGAVMEGDARALEHLDRAIAAARQEPKTDRGYVEKLEALRAERATRLEAYRSAR